MVRTPRFDPLAPEVLPSPYPAYTALRRHDPVHWGAAADTGRRGSWYITRYNDVAAALKDQRFGREVQPAPAFPPQDALLARVADGWMILRDPPAHTRLRGLVQAAYAPRRIARLKVHITRTAHALIDAMMEHPQPVDLLNAFALPLTVRLTAHVLGLPADDYDRLMPWSRALAAIIDVNQESALRGQSRDAVAELVDYLQVLLARRRHAPEDDILSGLLALQVRPDGPTDDELIGTLTHLLFVGNDPVMHMFGNGLIALAAHAGQHTQLTAQPELMPNALDELMRYDSPVQMTFRYVLEDLEFGGRRLRAGDHVAVVLGSANRDPACCPEPDYLDITRPVGQAAHFGMGIHYCLGAPLARLEGQIGLAALLARLPELAPADSPLVWQQTAAVRGVEALPVVWTRPD
jgi:cytochrome P450